MKEMATVKNAALDGISVTYSVSPSFPGDEQFVCFPFAPPTLPIHELSLFLRRGDYWIIGYQGEITFLKASRGLHCLSVLLRHPGREFHVRELLRLVVGTPLVPNRQGKATDACQETCLSGAGPLLDAQAKREYKRRLDDLQKDLEEAERFDDLNRAALARDEIDAIAEQLSLAVGLGGRNRRTGSEAERARSAVTKRIKNSINRIGEAIPLLRSHLAARIKTGYFCSYNPPPDRPVAWKF